MPNTATELGRGRTTVTAHLKVLKIDKAGVFLDVEEKEFGNKDGLAL